MDILRLLAYNHWANGSLTKQIEKLPPTFFLQNFGGSFGSIQATLTHVFESDWIWLTRFQGSPTDNIPTWSFADAHTLIDRWNTIQHDMQMVVRKLIAESKESISFKTRAGHPLVMPLSEIITHISHHGSYHRGQVANMIRMAGEKPVGTDYFLFSIQNK
ncbi:DinB family protein [Pseudochryseolinea flava]|uniref:Damage-inducible protein DinB n=1 Tax=Pseudochryseolinea flava TaxID=2059302 RepID=A0A364Y5G8_9BACT|nr:DinB family protein [Pseudochryseolinea flava]RAW02238.1 hypothetical protein DQQ10_06765 [Pseudochryseolinea flava]